MAKGERSYWLVSAESPVMSVIREALDIQRVFSEAMDAIKKEFGANEVWTVESSRFLGLAFKSDPPVGWRSSKKYCVPDKRVKIGKELAKRLRELPIGVDGMRFSGLLSEALGMDFTHWADGFVAWSVYEKYGDMVVLSVPSGLKICEISACSELKMSELWKIREDHDGRRGRHESGNQN